MISVDDLSPSELAALLAFHAEAGVEWLVEEGPVDRLAEFEVARSRRQAAPAPEPTSPPPERASERATSDPGKPAAGPVAAGARLSTRREPAIPDGEAVQLAKFAAESAGTLADLKAVLKNFDGCNLKRSARTTIFASGNAESGIMIVGSAPGAEDDREGIAFSGRAGELLDKMLGAIGIDRNKVLLTQAIPWRPPGNRSPSPAEVEICRPFIERQVALAAPEAVLLLGNLAARIFFGDGESIHGLRGRWQTIAAGNLAVSAIATMHPQDVLAAPLHKRLVWRDLQHFQTRLAELDLLHK